MSDVFGIRLYRTPYLVLPRLMLEAMPLEWQQKFEWLLQEAEDAGLKTPSYFVFRDLTHGNQNLIKGCRQTNYGQWDEEAEYEFVEGYFDDEWANYRRGDAWELSKK